MPVCARYYRRLKMSKDIKEDTKMSKGVIQDTKMMLNSYTLVKDRSDIKNLQ